MQCAQENGAWWTKLSEWGSGLLYPVVSSWSCQNTQFLVRTSKLNYLKWRNLWGNTRFGLADWFKFYRKYLFHLHRLFNCTLRTGSQYSNWVSQFIYKAAPKKFLLQLLLQAKKKLRKHENKENSVPADKTGFKSR